MKKNLISLALVSLLASNAAIAASYQEGDFVVRGGATMVAPDDGKAGVYLDGTNSGLEVSVDDNTQLGLNFVYFFDRNWAVEVLAATPFTHDVQLHAGNEETTLAEVTHLPPTVSAIYYFNTGSKFKPYVGAGLNYTVFFDEEFQSGFEEAGFSDLELDGSFGFALQVGADYQLNDKWHVNASARYIDIGTEANFLVADSIKGTADVDVDPMVFSLMLGYKF
ncbi:OmpW/AlkL family protein [Thalassotalea crassostreae]|uniref:OmpW/AlkL family protein n=1 Tax=Thalassotalea crassostreae TaxID=1763536 RepID=UPI00083856AE|nr:OmpW family outer membrane protein [Thalassotalea crassostreae]